MQIIFNSIENFFKINDKLVDRLPRLSSIFDFAFLLEFKFPQNHCYHIVPKVKAFLLVTQVCIWSKSEYTPLVGSAKHFYKVVKSTCKCQATVLEQ
jgi:hypothetical protein